jgi:hypothetical protein
MHTYMGLEDGRDQGPNHPLQGPPWLQWLHKGPGFLVTVRKKKKNKTS